MPAHDVDETRADIARRRLAELAANFNASLPEIEDESEDESAAKPDENPRFGRVLSLGKNHVKFLVFAGVAALLLVGWWLFSGTGSASPAGEAVAINQGPASAVASGGATKEPETLIVHVVGKVKQPGIVTVPAGARVADVIEAAGGTRGKVNLAELNLARLVADGEQVRVGIAVALDPGLAAAGTPSGTGGSGTGGAGGGTDSSSIVNLNTADATELETLPGVGPVTAKAILDWRTTNQRFSTVEDLLDVRGIGEATLERLRPLVAL